MEQPTNKPINARAMMLIYNALKGQKIEANSSFE